jgi:hypothetical protein
MGSGRRRPETEGQQDSRQIHERLFFELRFTATRETGVSNEPRPQTGWELGRWRGNAESLWEEKAAPARQVVQDSLQLNEKDRGRK